MNTRERTKAKWARYMDNVLWSWLIGGKPKRIFIQRKDPVCHPDNPPLFAIIKTRGGWCR